MPRASKSSTTPTKPRAPRAKKAPASAADRPARRTPETLRAASIVASLTVNDLGRSLAFYTDGLGFHIKERWERDGLLIGVNLVAGASHLLLNQDDFAKGRDRAKGVGLRFWVNTSQNVEAFADRAKAAGVTLAHDVQTLPWGSRAFTVVDPDGYVLTIGSPNPG